MGLSVEGFWDGGRGRLEWHWTEGLPTSASRVYGVGFRVLGFGVLGFGVWGLGFRVGILYKNGFQTEGIAA